MRRRCYHEGFRGRPHGWVITAMKVTDKRIFTPEGELKEEFRHLSEGGEAREGSGASPSEEPSPAGSSPEPPKAPEAAAGSPPEATPPGSGFESSASEGSAERLELPATPPEMGGPGFLDLVGIIAEPVAIYLGDVQLPDGQTAENLEVARFHIDLLDVLRQKTSGNLSAQELAVLDDVLYRLRLRYVQKRG